MDSAMRPFLTIVFLILAGCVLPAYAQLVSTGDTSKTKFSREDVRAAQKLMGLDFNNQKIDSMLDGLADQRRNYEAIRKCTVPNSVPPAILFNPIPKDFKIPNAKKKQVWSFPGKVTRPANLEDVAFYSVARLAELIRTKKVTSVELTNMYIARLKRFDPILHCVITLTEDRALRMARQADKEIAAGKYRGPLHGIPYGVKDLLAVKGYPTTWGAEPYRDQTIDEDASVVKKLDAAGAVLVAKLTLGALAMDDVWFGGLTRNPWDTSKGSSGSSAGSASATSAGLVAFGIGSETWGSIVSPSTVCGTTGLRPTYGRVSRVGAMALSWSMDKLGPICRTVEDCALVFNAIQGADGIDQTLYEAPFNYSAKTDIRKLRIGYLQMEFDSAKDNKVNNDSVLTVFRSMGIELIPVQLPKYPMDDLSIILTAEAGAAFDDLTRSGRDSMLSRQTKGSWPNIFRLSRFIPAVEYIQANRVRYLAIQDMEKLMNQVDVIITPPWEGNNSIMTNLTGHPCVVVPDGFSKEGTPVSITFLGKLFGEADLLAVAKKYQDATTCHVMHPKMFINKEK